MFILFQVTVLVYVNCIVFLLLSGIYDYFFFQNSLDMQLTSILKNKVS